MPNQVAVDTLSFTIQDGSKEKSTTRLNIRQLTDFSTYDAAVTALRDAIAGITNGIFANQTASLSRGFNSPLPSPDSFREIKVAVQIRDTVTFELSTFTIPTLDINAVTIQPNTDLLDMTATLEGELKTAIEALVASPRGNPVTVREMRVVGRNL